MMDLLASYFGEIPRDEKKSFSDTIYVVIWYHRLEYHTMIFNFFGYDNAKHYG